MSGSWPAEIVAAVVRATRALEEPFTLDRALEGIVEAALSIASGERAVLHRDGRVVAERTASLRAPALASAILEHVAETGRSFGPAGLDGVAADPEPGACALPVCAAPRAVLGVRLNGCPLDSARWSALRHLAGLASLAFARAGDAAIAARFRETAAKSEELRARAERRRSERLAGSRGEAAFAPIVGCSEAVLDHFAELDRAAAEARVILLTGTTGSGKELAARAIHALARGKGPFVVRNVSRLRGDRLESELHGHVRGAFTGAVADAPGLFEQAHGGVLFLDEIQALGEDGQNALMRIVEDFRVSPVGGRGSRPVDVTLVVATNADLRALSRAGRFREDLYCRLTEQVVQVPTLESRREDIPLLVHAWLAALEAPYEVEDEAMSFLLAAPWPGGIRTLKHVVESAFDARLGILAAERVRREFRKRTSMQEEVPSDLDALSRRIEELERLRLVMAFHLAKGRRDQAAALLGMTREGLRRKAKRYRLHVPLPT